MYSLNSYKQIISQFPSQNLFEFKHENHIYVLVGYPDWRTFIINMQSGLKLEDYSCINVTTRKLEFLEEPPKGKAKDRFYLKVNDPAVMESYLEKEKKFFNTIPEDIINRVKVFSDSHWEFIKAVSVYGHHFVTLIDSNPVLAYLLVNLEKINTSFSLYIDRSYMKTLITEKQKEILELADFPATKSMVKILSKFDPRLVDVECLNSFRLNLLSKPERQEKILKILSHSRVVNINLLHVIAFSPGILDIVSSCALQVLIKSDSFSDTFNLLKTMCAKAYEWKIEFRIERLDSIRKAEENINAAVQKRKDELNYFPPPPIPDGVGITALRSVAQQKSWAKKQQNCIRDYVKVVMGQRYYLYKVIFDKEEATLGILIEEDELKLGQLKGFKNQSVSNELRIHVKKWFDEFIIRKNKLEGKQYKISRRISENKMDFDNSIKK